MRRLARLALISVLLLLAATPARAHNPTQVVIRQPAHGAEVSGDVVVVLGSDGTGDAAATVTVLLDGKPVGLEGDVGTTSLFRTHRVPVNGSRTLTLRPVSAGRHQLVVSHAADADSALPDVVRTFTYTGGADTAGRAAVLWLALLVALVGAAGIAFVRTRAHRAVTHQS